MKTLKARHNGVDLFIYRVSKFLEYALVSTQEDGTQQFKININELENVTEDELYGMLRQQELEEQLKKGAP